MLCAVTLDQRSPRLVAVAVVVAFWWWCCCDEQTESQHGDGDRALYAKSFLGICTAPLKFCPWLGCEVLPIETTVLQQFKTAKDTERASLKEFGICLAGTETLNDASLAPLNHKSPQPLDPQCA